MYVCVGVHPHVCLLIGRVVARTAVQREGGALPLAMLGHVTLEKGLAVCLEPAHVTPIEVGATYGLILTEAGVGFVRRFLGLGELGGVAWVTVGL